MCRKLCFLIAFILLIGLSAGTALGEVAITVENYNFESPGGAKRDISWDVPGIVPGWANMAGVTTSAGVEYPWNGASEGVLSAFLGKDALIVNFTGQKVGTDFLIQSGDKFELTFDSKSLWAANKLRAQLYYYDDPNRVVVATKDVDLASTLSWPVSGPGPWGTYTLEFNAVDVPASYDHEIGMQFQHLKTRGDNDGGDNIWAELDYVRLTLTTPLMRAQNPSPANESLYTGSGGVADLTWVAGPNASADDYHVYLSANRANVASGGGDADRGLTGGATSKTVTGLTRNATTAKPYYWRIDTLVDPNTYRGNIWSFNLRPNVAFDPVPNTGATMVDNNDPVLSWTAGAGAESGHNVYFSKNFNEVNDAATGSTALPFRASLDVADTNWSPTESGMPQFLDANNTTYYWRIDEVNSTGITKGIVWNFTTVPVWGIGKITREIWTGIGGNTVVNLTDSANYPDSPNLRDTLTTFEEPHSALVDYGSRVHGYLFIQNTGDYTFWIASGENSELWLEGELIAYVNGLEGRDNWTNPRQWHKYPEIQQSAPIPLVGGKSYYIMVLHKKAWGVDNLSVAWQGPDQPKTVVDGDPNVIIPGSSLGQFDPSRQVWASYPRPATKTTNTEPTIILKWKPGVKAANVAGHDVYFGDNLDAVKDANSLDPSGPTEIYRGRQDANDYNIPETLEWGKTYYWRIDEVNNTTIWKGGVWRFTVRNYSVVDNFEDYNNTPGNTTILEKWKTNSTGKVGYSDPNYAEMTIFHEGRQSMPFDYNNVKSPYYSDVNRTFDSPQNWATITSGPYTYHPKSLTLWFRGYPERVGSFSYTGTANPYAATITACGVNIGDVRDLRRPSRFHDEFHFGYKAATSGTTTTLPGTSTNFTGVKVVARVDSLGYPGDTVGKAGVMIRDLLDANSVNGFMYVRRTTSAGYGVAFSYRYTAKGGTTTQTATDVNDTGITLPCWVAIILQTGSGFRNVRAYYSKNSTNGTNGTWYQLGTVQQFPSGTMYLPKPGSAPIYVGLAVTPQSDTAKRMAKFSSVTLTAGAAGTWTSRDISIKSNVAAPLYVTLQDSNSPTPVSKTVNHPDNPYMVQQNTWQQWDIPLSDFTGVNLAKVRKITLGVGHVNGDPYGAGTLYFDDIRVYIPRCIANRKAPDFTGTDCLIDNQDLRILIDNWLVRDYQVTPPVGFLPDTDPNLEAWYNLESNLNDSSSHDRTGDPCGNTLTYVTDSKVGTKALSLNGLNETFAVPQMVKNDFTLMAWIKTATPGNQEGTQAYQGSGLLWSDIAGDANDFIMAVLGTKLAFGTGPNNGDTTTSGKVVFGPAQWVHVAVTRVRSSGQIKLYINGMLDRAVIHNNANISLNRNPKINIGGNTIDQHYYPGLIDDVRIYSRALTQAEVAQIAGTAMPFNQPLAGLLTQSAPAINMYPDGVIDLKDYALLAQVWLETVLWP
jgi:hypothetical protein